EPNSCGSHCSPKGYCRFVSAPGNGRCAEKHLCSMASSGLPIVSTTQVRRWNGTLADSSLAWACGRGRSHGAWVVRREGRREQQQENITLGCACNQEYLGFWSVWSAPDRHRERSGR